MKVTLHTAHENNTAQCAKKSHTAHCNQQSHYKAYWTQSNTKYNIHTKRCRLHRAFPLHLSLTKPWFRGGILTEFGKPRKLGPCKIWRAWVKILTEHIFFSSIYCPNFALFWLKALINAKPFFFCIFGQLIVYYKVL